MEQEKKGLFGGFFRKKKEAPTLFGDVPDFMKEEAAQMNYEQNVQHVQSSEHREQGEQGEQIAQEVIDYAKEKLTGIITAMQIDAHIKLVSPRFNRLLIVLEGEDVGRIIGKEGHTLNALQTILASMVNKKYQQRHYIVLDANNYRKRKERSLANTAQNAARMVIRDQKEIALDPMPSEDRKIIHMELAEHPQVYTYSRGERSERQIVVAYGKKPEPEAQPQPEEV